MPEISPIARKAGDPFPEKEAGKLRLYSMRFCPFAQRTALALMYKKVPYETVNINLGSKPDWFLERAPLGAVPVLECDDKIIYESPVCNDWVDTVYPGVKLNPSDPYVFARQKMLAGDWSKVVSQYYTILRTRDADLLPKFNEQLKLIEKSLSEPFFAGSQVGNIDFYIWPHFERIPVVSFLLKDFTLNEYPKLLAWKERMVAVPAVQETMFSPEDHKQFYEDYLTSKENVNYDMGL